MFVELTRLQVQGLVHVSGISRHFVRYDSQKETLRDGHVTYAFGARVKVYVTRVDFDKRQLDFTLADSRPPPAAQPAKPHPDRQQGQGRQDRQQRHPGRSGHPRHWQKHRRRH
jgi:ribonuclease R